MPRQPGQRLCPRQRRVCPEEQRLSNPAASFQLRATGTFNIALTVLDDILAALVFFALARNGRIERQADEFYGVDLIDACEHVLGLLDFGLHIQLPAEDLLWWRIADDLLRCHAGVLRDYLKCAKGLTRLRDAPFAVGVREAGHCSRGNEDGHGELVAEEGSAGVAARAVDEDPRTEQDGAVDSVVEVFRV